MKTSSPTAITVSKSLLILSLFLISAAAFSQDTLKAGAPADLVKQNNVCSNNRWYYFKLSDTIAVKVIDHLPVPASLGLRSGSMTIAETQRGDIIRIIDAGNDANHYSKGQTIKVAPANKPAFSLSTALTPGENPNTKKPEPSTFDLAVQKTTWGSLLTN